MRCMVKIGIEKGGPKKDGSGDWPDKNTIAAIITPDKREWHAVNQPPPSANGSGGAAPTSAASGPASGSRVRVRIHVHGSSVSSTNRCGRLMRRIGTPAASAIEDEWQRRATAAAIEAARGVVKVDGPIPPLAPIGRLGDGDGRTIIRFGWDPGPRRTGDRRKYRHGACHPHDRARSESARCRCRHGRLAGTSETPGIDWSVPLSTWSRDTMITFLLAATRLIDQANRTRPFWQLHH